MAAGTGIEVGLRGDISRAWIRRKSVVVGPVRVSHRVLELGKWV